MAKSHGRCDIGVDYFFYGTFAVTPPVSGALRDEINDSFDPWQISDDCDAICVADDQVRNAWDHDKDLAILVAKLTALGHTMEGEILGEINDEGEFWKFTMEDGKLLYHNGYRGYAAGVPIETGDANAHEAV